jgi:hypothetical protein
MADLYLVFVHGWSVDDLSTYGQLPIRLRNEFAARGINTVVRQIWLGQYISFRDEVRLPDISRAFQAAVNQQLSDIVQSRSRFICITHSTGAPVIRDWWDRFYRTTAQACPMSHLIMLAPANFGSALAQLGKSKLSQLKFWLHGEQPGQGILDWLELGSAESWELNSTWIKLSGLPTGPAQFYPFVIIGQSIDRNFYDHLNRYTGELGSDGVVRSAAANLNATLITIEQTFIRNDDGAIQDQPSPPVINFYTAPSSAFRIVTHRSHSGNTMGIITSVGLNPSPDPGERETIDAIILCTQISNDSQYETLRDAFDQATVAVQAEERLEIVPTGPFAIFTRHFIHDHFCMVIFRVRDSQGYPISDFKLVFTGPDDNPNHLPEGFFADRQQNQLTNEVVTYFVNYDVLKGSDAVKDPSGNVIRPATPGIKELGLEVTAQPATGFVRYMPLKLTADESFFQKMVKPNATILIDIVLQRLVSDQVFLNKGPIVAMPQDGSFKSIQPGDGVVPDRFLPN